MMSFYCIRYTVTAPNLSLKKEGRGTKWILQKYHIALITIHHHLVQYKYKFKPSRSDSLDMELLRMAQVTNKKYLHLD